MRSIQKLTVFLGIWTLVIFYFTLVLIGTDMKSFNLPSTVNDGVRHNGSLPNDLDCAPCRCPSESNAHQTRGGVPSIFGKAHHEMCIWPTPNDTRDRILPQMDLDKSTNDEFRIYVSRPYIANMANQDFISGTCPVDNCRVYTDEMDKADLILLHDFDMSLHKAIRRLKSFASSRGSREPPIVVWYMLESPLNRGNFNVFNDLINWTATYRRDSVINTPYERFTYYEHFNGVLPPPTRNFAANKTKKAAAFISNCKDQNGRLRYISELQRYISVDVYGACGTLSCPRTGKKPDPCFVKLKNEYKFYLSFENSNCRHYITEKFYWNALLNDVLPIVMGAAPQDYAIAAPPHSYIHVDDFESPEHLASYLHKLDMDDDLYSQYFRWQGTGSFINTKFWCRLCAMLNEAKLSGTRVWYGNVQKWWNGPGVCVKPGSKGWASWRDIFWRYDYADNDTLHVKL